MEIELLNPILAFRGLSDEEDEDSGDIDLDDGKEDEFADDDDDDAASETAEEEEEEQEPM